MLAGLLLPAMSHLVSAEDRGDTRRSVIDAGLACFEYRLRHGAYPEKLDQLIPAFLSRLPIDRLSGQPLQYRTDGNTFTVYSIGLNGKDDAGLSQPPSDDVAFSDPILSP
jgi:hypothetical protein